MQAPDDDRPTVKELAPGALRRERLLPGPVDDAWALLRDAEGLAQWLADEVDLIVAPGEHGVLREGDETRLVTVESVEEGRRVSLSWQIEPGEFALVDLVLDEVDGVTRLVVTEVPLRLVAAPALVPTDWQASGTHEGPQASGPQALALACH